MLTKYLYKKHLGVTTTHRDEEGIERKEQVQGGAGDQAPPTVEANLTEDFFFEMQDGEDHDGGDRGGHSGAWRVRPFGARLLPGPLRSVRVARAFPHLMVRRA